MADLTPQEDSLVAALIAKFDEREAVRETHAVEDSGAQWKTIKKLVAIKDVVMFVGLIGSVLYGAFVVLDELKAKPSNDDMHNAIEQRVQPVEEIATKNANTVKRVESKVGRIEDVQGYQLEQSSWEGDVLEHIGSRKRGKAPPRPESLKNRERELLAK